MKEKPFDIAYRMWKSELTPAEIERETKGGIKADTVRKWIKRHWTTGQDNRTGQHDNRTPKKKYSGADGNGKGINGNLVPITERPNNEARELSSKGGKASGEARRKKKVQRRTLKEILALTAPSKITAKLIENKLLENGVEIDLETARQYQLAMLAVIDGDISAIKYIDSRTGLDPVLKLRKKELKAKQNSEQMDAPIVIEIVKEDNDAV